MIINKELLDSLTAQAKVNPRLRQAYDLRNSSEDKSQRMLNALEPGTVLPIHRHKTTSEVTSVVRGRLRQNIYDVRSTSSGTQEVVLVESFEASAYGFPNFYVVPAGQWHNTECLESGTVIFEAKDGAYAPLQPDDILDANPQPVAVSKETESEEDSSKDDLKKHPSTELRKQITYLIGMERHSGSMEVITPQYVSRMLNVPLEEVEQCISVNNLL